MGSKKHEDVHVKLFKSSWRFLVGNIEGVVNTCMSEGKAMCYAQAIMYLSMAYEKQAQLLNAHWDCVALWPSPERDEACAYEKQITRKAQSLMGEAHSRKCDCDRM